MIQVEFIVDPNSDVDSQLREWARIMPWMKYLIDNFTDFDYKIYRKADTYQEILKVTFYLPPQKETFFNLKYR